MDEDGAPRPAPFLWMVSRVCEEFNVLPTRALWELEHDPEQMALRIIELRAYAAAKRAYAEVKPGEFEALAQRMPMVLQVRDIEHALAKEEWDRRRAAAIAAAEAEDV